MKPDAIFINVARGAVADEAALTEAIEQNRLGGLESMCTVKSLFRFTSV